MNKFSHIAAEALAGQGKKLTFKHSSVFAGLELTNSTEDVGMVANKIASGLNNRLNIIRNNILPHVKTFKRLVTDKIASVPTVSTLSKFTIIERGIPEIIPELKSKKLISLTDNNMELPMTTLVIPVPENIKTYITYGDAVLNAYLETSLSSFTEESLIKLWSKVLGDVSVNNDYINNLTHNTIDKIDEIIILLAICATIKKEKQPGIRISDGNYFQAMDILNTYLGNLLLKIEDKITLNEKFDKMIMSVTDNTIIVNKTMYDTFLETNENEVLLGLLYSGDANVNMTVTDIVINKDTYSKTWENAITRENFRQISEAPNKYRITYELMLEELYGEFGEAEEDFVYCDLNTAKIMLREELQEITDKYNGEKLLDIDYITREIMGEIVFKDTMLESYLSSMYGYHNLDNNLSVEELTTMASIDMIVEYLLNQVNVEQQ